MHFNSHKWNSILFEGRNKAYGAFKLRAASSRRHFVSFIIVMAIFGGAFGIYLIIDKINYVRMFTNTGSLPSIQPIEMEQSLDVREYAEEQAVSATSKEHNAATNQIQQQQTTEVNSKVAPNSKLTLDEFIQKTIDNPPDIGEKLPDTTAELEPDQTYLVVDVMPVFPGGKAAMFHFITENMRYPQDAQRRQAQGRVVCEFIVNKDGTVSDITVAKKIDPALDREAVRVLKLMPKWKPGERLGRPVRVKFSVPFNFSI